MPIHFTLPPERSAVHAVLAANLPLVPNTGPRWPEPEAALPVVDLARLAEIHVAMTDVSFSYLIYCYLLDIEFHLEEIMRARDAADFAVVTRKAHILADTAGKVGAMRTSAAARKLEMVCREEGHGQTFRLIAELSQCCTEAETQLRRFMVGQTDQPGAA